MKYEIFYTDMSGKIGSCIVSASTAEEVLEITDNTLKYGDLTYLRRDRLVEELNEEETVNMSTFKVIYKDVLGNTDFFIVSASTAEEVWEITNNTLKSSNWTYLKREWLDEDINNHNEKEHIL